MNKVVIFVVFLAAAYAAPHYGHRGHWHHHHHYPSYTNFNSDEIFGEQFFDTRRFWSELSSELAQFETIMQDFHNRFASSASNSEYKNGKYIITIPLNGFDEKDIKVSVKESLLMIQAVHQVKETNSKSYLDLRTLPNNIKAETGSYSYENNILRLTFDAIESNEDDKPTTVSPVTENGQDYHSREEMEHHDEEDPNAEAEVNSNRGDQDKDNELLTNEIPTRSYQVEATTFPIHINKEVDFVPVKY